MKYGLLPRTYDPTIPHMSALASRAEAISLPQELNYSTELSQNLGMMGNDRWGDCAWAAAYHAIQLVSRKARGVEITEPDEKVLLAYKEATGFDPDTNYDPGTVLQEALRYMTVNGLPIMPSPAPRDRHKIIGPVEIDHRLHDDIKRAIYECGFVYIGFTVPAYFNQGNRQTWDFVPGQDSLLNEGHCIILPGWNADGSFIGISWGSRNYTLTPAFIDNCVDEIYAWIDPTWMQSTKLTLLGLSESALAQLMRSFAQPISSGV